MTSLLAVFAHPDDESIACGGLLAWCAEHGVRVSLLCVTRGEDAASADADRGTLGKTRTRELQAAAAALSIAEVATLDYPDGELEWLPDDRGRALEADIAAAIRRTRADVVVTFDEDGLYWHPDHIALHHRTTAAVRSFGVEGPALYYVSMPEGAMRALVDAVGGHVLGIDDPDAWGTLAPPPTLVIDVSVHANRKLAALKCHASQVAGGAFERLDEARAARLLGVEQLRRSPAGRQGPTFLDTMTA
jgi:N-acetyl-1-D-myo-inositol-2-amino-2-deoxy-alpha-D-glucopyranoside deacetylase